MKKLFNQLMPFLNRKYYNGRMIRWMIEDVNGRSVSCFCCGNIANMIGEVTLMGWLFRLPVCKKHTADYLQKHNPNDWAFQSPGTFTMNLKYVPESFDSWSMRFLKLIAEKAGLTFDDFRQPIKGPIAFFRTPGHLEYDDEQKQNIVRVDPLKN